MLRNKLNNKAKRTSTENPQAIQRVHTKSQ